MTEDWFVVSTLPAPPGQELMLVDALRRAGARAVEREGERYLALFPVPEDVGTLIASVRSAIRAATTLADPQLTWRRQSHAEWAARWRSEQAARRASDRIVVAPVGVELTGAVPAEGGPQPAVGPDDVVLRLDPGVAFGTAEHPTTRSCLALLDGRVAVGSRFLDVGAGSGILAIAAVLLGADEALALEMDPVSCDAARRNAGVNGVADRVEVREVEVTPAYLRQVGRFDGVVINIEARVSAALLPAAPAAMAPDGWLMLSGLVGSERDDAVMAAQGTGLTLIEEAPVRSWWTGLLARA